MSRTVGLMIFALALCLPQAASAQSDEERYTIMRPERPQPWLAPKYTSPRGTRERIVPPPSDVTPRRRGDTPPPIVVPETSRVLPNFAPAPNTTGREGFQDRAARCAHQAGVYGDAVGSRNSYIGTCINQ